MRPRQNDGLIAFWRAWKQRRRGVDFEELTRPHIDALWRTALRMTGDRGSADEITQETCLRAYRSFDGFEPGTNYRAWIFRILVNLCLDHARRGKRSPLVETEIEALPAQDSLSTSREDSPEGLLARKRTRQSVHQAMEALSPKSARSCRSRCWRNVATRRSPRSSAVQSAPCAQGSAAVAVS